MAAGICAQHTFQHASSMTALLPARYQCGALGCRKQIVEVQSHDYDKHSDSDAHFSNGECVVQFVAANTQLDAALTALLPSWHLRC